MGWVIFGWFVGAFVSTFVFKARAGVSLWYRPKAFGEGGLGLEWLMINSGKALAWPVVLVVWLANGQPEPRIVFNHKAVAREKRMADGSAQA